MKNITVTLEDSDCNPMMIDVSYNPEYVKDFNVYSAAVEINDRWVWLHNFTTIHAQYYDIILKEIKKSEGL